MQRGLAALRIIQMALRALPCALCLLVASCSFINDADFELVDSQAHDGGPDAAGSGGDGGNGSGGQGGNGTGGQGGNGTGGQGGTGGTQDSGPDALAGSGGDTGPGDECDMEDDCEDNRICLDGACVFECTLEDDCESPKLCVDRRCEFECELDEDCSPTYTCEQHQCIPPVRTPAGVWSSAGGGLRTSQNFKLRISVGAPQPFGAGASETFKLQLGPSAGRP